MTSMTPWRAAGRAALRLAATTALVLPALLTAPALAADYKEAPALAAQAAAGKLPAVAARLPVHPLVEKGATIGRYGGNWNSVLLGASDTFWLIKTIGYESLTRWDNAAEKIIPNLAESVTANADQTVFTVKLREGLKWSDGAPFTADDILFWYEDVIMAKELTPTVPSWLRAGDQPVKVEKLGPTELRFSFAAPNGIFLLNEGALVNNGINTPLTAYPKHYLSRFHAKYNPNADAEAKAAGAPGWAQRFMDITGPNSRWRIAGVPTMAPWMLTDPYDQSPLVVAERNPYYFKVDGAGNQLPYLDKVIFPVLDDVEAILLRAMKGEIDFIDRHITINRNKPVIFDGQAQGNYKLYATTPSLMNTMVIYLNQTSNDAVKREIFNNRDFRIGLSHAINRQKIIDVIYLGQGEPFQAAPRPGTKFYSESMAKQYTEYSKDKANAALDKAGYAKRDGNGFRLGPDGKRISFAIEAPTDFTPQWIDILELIKADWTAVGIDMQIRPEARSLLATRAAGNEHDATVWRGDGGAGADVFLEPVNYLPLDATYKPYGVKWTAWYTSGGKGEAPPETIRKQFQLYDQLKAAGDEAGRDALMRQILANAAEDFRVIGISLEPQGYGMVKTDFRNLPDPMPVLSMHPTPGVTNPELYYKAK
jgi:peptide/nickel transport system substrate-binding protein